MSDRAALLRWVEVDTAALRHNAAAVRGLLAGNTALMAMVKADGYGHDAVISARAALQGGATWLGVYSAEEALRLRDAGIDARILVAGWTPPAQQEELVRRNADITIFDARSAESLAEAARRAGKAARVHVKIDTGMHRLGARPEELDALLGVLRAQAARVTVTGCYTHFADSENPRGDFTAVQHQRFLALLPRVQELAAECVVHTANSGAILRFPETHHDLVRLGIALYGYAPVETTLELRIAMRVVARVSHVKTVQAGDTVGYGRTWTATGARRIATVPVGYADGFWRARGAGGSVIVGSSVCPVVGRVSMDQITVDVSDAAEVGQGDEVTLLGESGGRRVDAAAIAAQLGTIPHEVLCGVGRRLPRIAV